MDTIGQQNHTGLSNLFIQKSLNLDQRLDFKKSTLKIKGK